MFGEVIHSKKMVALNAVTSLTVNSVMEIFLQVLQNFRNTAAFKSTFKNTFCQRTNQNMLS